MMMVSPTRWTAVLLLALAGGCGIRSTPGSQPGAGASDIMSAKDRARLEAVATARSNDKGDRGYLIGPDDLLEIRIPDLTDDVQHPSAAENARSGAAVAGTPVFERGIRVGASGDVTIPLIGAVHAEGLTPTALEQTITRRLVQAEIMRNPEVSVQIVEYRSRVAAVVGSVERPGLYPLTRPGTTLADLVWAAGGPSKEAGRLLEFVPAGEDSAGAIRVDLPVLLQAAGGPKAMNPLVRPGDLVTLAPAGSVLVDGWVDHPGAYPVTRGLTVSGAVAAAGGQLFPADGRRATVERRVGEERLVAVDLTAISEGKAADLPISDGDVVRLPASPVRVVPWGVWEAIRSLIRFGGTALL